MSTRAARVVTVVLLVLVAAVAVAALWFRAAGGSWVSVRTPSMGRTAPVGTMLLVGRPDTPRVGEFVTFRPPTASHELYAHRIVAIGPTGAIKTKGDANGSADAWTLQRSDITGRVIVRLWWLGWLAKLLPLVVLGLFATFVVSRFVALKHRLAVQLLLGSLSVSVAVLMVRPLVRLVMLLQYADDGTSYTTVVPTGLLPVRASARHGTSINLVPGQIGTTSSSQSLAQGDFHVSFGPHLTWPLWIGMVALWCVPLMIAVVFGVPPQALGATGEGAESTA